MARYTPGNVSDPQIQDELNKIAQAAETADVMLNLDMLYAAPKKFRVGSVVLADGNLWKPTGAATPGFYGYYGGAWHLLG